MICDVIFCKLFNYMGELISTDEVKKIEISILDYIDSVCKEKGLNYYLAYGTLLGAVRHKGFIPWDDDIDICMKREDYDQFIKYAGAIDNARYKLCHRSLSKHYTCEYAKVIDITTKIEGKEVEIGDDDGLWVDIFPLDVVPRHDKLIRFIIQASVAFRVFSIHKTFPKKRNIIWYPIWLLSRLIGPYPFLRITDKLSQIGERGDRIGYMASLSASSDCKYSFPKSYFDGTEYLVFEGKKYPAPPMYDAYLKSQYGDYMQLPPVEKRVPHPIEAYWR